MAKNGVLSPGPIPVVVCAETVKFSTKVVLDGLAMNELGDPDRLVDYEDDGIVTCAVTKTATPAVGSGKKSKASTAGKGETAEKEEVSRKKAALEGWNDQQNLHLLNLVYDVTPPEYLDMVITELGCIAPNAVSAVNGVWGDD